MFEKLERIIKFEKLSGGRSLEKCVIFNKCDMFHKKGLKDLEERENFLIIEYNCEVFRISVKSCENFREVILFIYFLYL